MSFLWVEQSQNSFFGTAGCPVSFRGLFLLQKKGIIWYDTDSGKTHGEVCHDGFVCGTQKEERTYVGDCCGGDFDSGGADAVAGAGAGNGKGAAGRHAEYPDPPEGRRVHGGERRDRRDRSRQVVGHRPHGGGGPARLHGARVHAVSADLCLRHGREVHRGTGSQGERVGQAPVLFMLLHDGGWRRLADLRGRERLLRRAAFLPGPGGLGGPASGGGAGHNPGL